MSKWVKKIKIKTILLAAAFMVAAATIGVTFAWQTWNLDMTNVLTAHSTVVSIDEDFNAVDGRKEVQFTNKGSSSVFLRVSYTEFWELEGKKDVTPSYVLSNTVNYDGEIWQIAHKNLDWVGGDADNPLWLDGKDGWFYYNRVLKAGESTGRILTKVWFEEQFVKIPESQEGEVDEELSKIQQTYKDARYQLYFKAEVVQCSDGSNTLNSDEVNENATRKLFGKTARVGADGITVTWK